MRPTFPVSLSLMLLATACAPADQAAPVDIEAARSAIVQADRDWNDAYNSSDDPVRVFVDMMVDDGGALLLPPNAPIAVGKAQIETVITQLESLPGFSVQWSPDTAEVGSGGDLGYTVGTYSMTLPGPDGQTVRIPGKYLTAWKKQADGSWKVSADMFNASGPPTPVESDAD